MKRLRNIYAIALLTLAPALSAQSTLIDFDFVGNTGSETSSVGTIAVAGLSGTPTLSRGPNVKALANAWGANGYSFFNGDSSSASTLASAISSGVYSSFTFTVSSGTTASLSALDFGWARQNDRDRTFAVLASLDGGSTGFTSADVINAEATTVGTANNSTFATAHSLDLSGDARLQNIVGPLTVEIRLYHYGTSNNWEGNALSSGNSTVGLDLKGTIHSAIADPDAPTGLQTSVQSDTEIQLTWVDQSDSETSYKIERKTGLNDFVQIATTAANAQSYSDSTLSASTTYTFRIRAALPEDDSTYSNEATATTDDPPLTRYRDKPVRVFIFAGQSNMLGTGTSVSDAPEDIRTQPDILFDATNLSSPSSLSSDWETLGESVSNMGPEVTAAARFAEAYPDDQICIIKMSKGGTGLSYWRTPGEAGHDALMLRISTIAARLDAAVTAEHIPSWSFAGFLWMQGENEADGVVAPSLSYQADFDDLATKVRTQTADSTLPIIVGRISNLLDPIYNGPVEQPQLDNVRAAQVNWATIDSNAAWVDTDNLTLIDDFHFGSASQCIIGRRFAQAYFAASDARPELILSRATTQSAYSSSPAVLYQATFSSAVSNFDATDIRIHGNTQANSITVSETDPFDQTSYRVHIRGMSEPGTLSISASDAYSSSLDSLPSLHEATQVLWSTQSEANTLLSYAPMNTPTRDLLGSDYGIGWQGNGWIIQADFTGYQIESSNPLTYTNLQSSAAYAVGGDTWKNAGRQLDLENTYRPYMSSIDSGAIDLAGTTLWLSYLVRPQTADQAQRVGLNRGIGSTNTDATVSIEQVGSNWHLKVLGTDIDSGIAATVDQTHLMVLKLTIGGDASPSSAHLWVNPESNLLGGEAPSDASADATHTLTSSDFKFARLHWFPGSDTDDGALDEVRIGTSFAAVTPRSPEVVGALESMVRSHFAAAGLDHLPPSNFDPTIDYDDDGLTGFEEVLWSGNAADASNTGTATLTLDQKKAPPTELVYGNEIQLDTLGPDPLPSGISYSLYESDTLAEDSWKALTESVDFTRTHHSNGDGTAIYRATFTCPEDAQFFWISQFVEAP